MSSSSAGLIGSAYKPVRRKPVANSALQRQNRMLLLHESAFECCRCRKLTEFDASQQYHPLGAAKCQFDGHPACQKCAYDAPAFRIIYERARTHMKPDCGFICCYCGLSWLFADLRQLDPTVTSPKLHTEYRCLTCHVQCCNNCLRFQLEDDDAVPYEQVEENIIAGRYQPPGLPRSSTVELIEIPQPAPDERRRRSSVASLKGKIHQVFGRKKLTIGTPMTFEADTKAKEHSEMLKNLREAEDAVDKEIKKARKEGREVNTIGALHSVGALKPLTVSPEVERSGFQALTLRSENVARPEADKQVVTNEPIREETDEPQTDPSGSYYFIPSLEPLSPFATPEFFGEVYGNNVQFGGSSYSLENEDVQFGQGTKSRGKQPVCSNSTQSLARSSIHWESASDVPTTIAHYLVYGNRLMGRDEYGSGFGG